MKKVIKLGMLILFFVSLNFSALQDWDVPVIGVQEVDAGVPGCINTVVWCVRGGKIISVAVGCLWVANYSGANCNGCSMAC